MKVLGSIGGTFLAGPLASTYSRLAKDCRSLGFIVAGFLLCVPAWSSVWAQQPFREFEPVWEPHPVWKLEPVWEAQSGQGRSASGSEVGSFTVSNSAAPRVLSLSASFDAWPLREGAGRIDVPILGMGQREVLPIPSVVTDNRIGLIAYLNQPASIVQSSLRGDAKPETNVDTQDLDAQPPLSRRGSDIQTESVTRQLEALQRRIEELDKGRIAHEDATRTVIQKSFAERGSNINEFVVFGGTVETLAGWAKDFDRVAASDIVLDTAELDFEITVNDWTRGSIIFEYVDGTDILFPTSEGDEAFVDRMNVDTAFVTIGDTQKCWLFATAGRIVAPFGISTGDPVADVLTIESPLTVEVFETRQDVLMIGFEGPTPPPPSVAPKPTPGPLQPKPLLFAPAVRKLSRRICPCLKPAPPAAVATTTPTPAPPPFNGAIYVYNGDVYDGGEDHVEHFGATLGYRTKGVSHTRCIPWSLDMDVDFNSSVFDSRFLSFEYRHLLNQIGYVPGMAAHVKSSVGPVSLVVEWNGTLHNATFIDEALDPLGNIIPGDDISIAPSAWQIALAYQFDWNRTVEIIGIQGTYVTIGYSESQDLAGVTRVIAAEEQRVGFVPERRFLVGMGEWVLDGLRVAVEYSHIMDYSEADGGTGNSGNGVFTQLTYEW